MYRQWWPLLAFLGLYLVTVTAEEPPVFTSWYIKVQIEPTDGKTCAERCTEEECVAKPTILVDGETQVEPTQIEKDAEPGLSKCFGFEVARLLHHDNTTTNLTCWCQKSTIKRDPGVNCGPRANDNALCKRSKLDKTTWIDGKNTMMEGVQGNIYYIVQKAKEYWESVNQEEIED